MSRDSQTDDTRMPGKAPDRQAFMTALDDLFKLPNITDNCDAPDGGPLPGQYQTGNPEAGS